MAAAMLGAVELLEELLDDDFIGLLVELVIAGGIGTAVFFAAAWLLRVRDLAEFKRLVPGR